MNIDEKLIGLVIQSTLRFILTIQRVTNLSNMLLKKNF